MGYGVFFGIIYKIIGIADPIVIRYINVFSIAIITFMLYKITNIIYKDERRNKIVILFSLLFIQFPLLSTFVYGDIIGLMFVLIAVYQTLCVIKKEKNKIFKEMVVQIKKLSFDTDYIKNIFLGNKSTLGSEVLVFLYFYFILKEKENICNTEVKNEKILEFIEVVNDILCYRGHGTDISLVLNNEVLLKYRNKVFDFIKFIEREGDFSGM